MCGFCADFVREGPTGRGGGMSRFVSGRETVEIAAPWWDEGEVVTIRKLSFLDRRYIAGASTTYGEPDEEGNRIVRVDTEAMDLAILERGIVEWTLKAPPRSPPLENTGGREEVAPLTKGQLRRLAPEDGEYIVNAIHEYNPRRSAAEQAGFRAGAGDGAAE